MSAMLLIASILLLGLAVAAATIPASNHSSCTSPSKRPEWRHLSKAQKTKYIKAVQCLTTKPSRIGLNTSLYDDFAYVHANVSMDSKPRLLLLHSLPPY